MPDPKDVQPEPSPAAADTPADTPTAPSSVTDVEGAADERPLKNLKAEFDRKHDALRTDIATLTELVRASQVVRQAPTPAPQGWDQYTDEQLVQLYQAGSAEAGLKLQDRLIERKLATQAAQQTRQTTVQNQLAVLYAKYPALRDPSSPLHQGALRAKGVLLQTGMYQNGPEADVQAIMTAIADDPSLARPSAADTMRADVTSQNQIDGGKSRQRSPSPKPTTSALTEKERAIAARMGVKDPEKALERLYKRQERGQSSVSPSVAHIVREA